MASENKRVARLIFQGNMLVEDETDAKQIFAIIKETVRNVAPSVVMSGQFMSMFEGCCPPPPERPK